MVVQLPNKDTIVVPNGTGTCKAHRCIPATTTISNSYQHQQQTDIEIDFHSNYNIIYSNEDVTSLRDNGYDWNYIYGEII